MSHPCHAFLPNYYSFAVPKYLRSAFDNVPDICTYYSGTALHFNVKYTPKDNEQEIVVQEVKLQGKPFTEADGLIDWERITSYFTVLYQARIRAAESADRHVGNLTREDKKEALNNDCRILSGRKTKSSPSSSLPPPKKQRFPAQPVPPSPPLILAKRQDEAQGTTVFLLPHTNIISSIFGKEG